MWDVYRKTTIWVIGWEELRGGRNVDKAAETKSFMGLKWAFLAMGKERKPLQLIFLSSYRSKIWASGRKDKKTSFSLKAKFSDSKNSFMDAITDTSPECVSWTPFKNGQALASVYIHGLWHKTIQANIIMGKVASSHLWPYHWHNIHAQPLLTPNPWIIFVP